MNSSEILRLEIKEGDHLCSIYNNLEQQLSIIVPFMLHGLEKGEKCIFIIDEHTAENATRLFLNYGLDLNSYLKAGSFCFLSKEETYLKDGYFDPDCMIELLKANLQSALEEGYSGLRVTGEMTWVFSNLPGVERLMEYEAKLNQFLPGTKVTAICQYNEHRFQPDVLLDVLRTHPKVILYGHYYKNNYYEPPDIFLARLDGKITWDMYQKAIKIIMQLKEAEEKLHYYTLELEQLYRYLDQEIKKAQQIHEQILPTKLPSVQGVTMAAHYQPAAKMGGDFYNMIHVDNKLVFYLSDVSGHGLDGAMMSVFVKGAIDSYVTLKKDDLSPGNILKYLDRQYRRENYSEELFVAIFLAVLDLETMELTYCGAGFQETPLVRLGNGERIELVSRGLFISNSFPAQIMDFEEGSINLTTGSTLFFTTDGLTEYVINGSHYMDRLPDVFYANAHLPPNHIVSAIIEDLRHLNNGYLQGKDDITFLVLQVTE